MFFDTDRCRPATVAARTKLLPQYTTNPSSLPYSTLCRNIAEHRAGHHSQSLSTPVRCMTQCKTQCIRPFAVPEGQPSGLITSLIAHYSRGLVERGRLICLHVQPRLPTGPTAGEGKPAFENYLNLRFLPGPRAQFPSEWSTVWVTCVCPRLDRRPDHLLVSLSMASGGKIGARIFGRMT